MFLDWDNANPYSFSMLPVRQYKILIFHILKLLYYKLRDLILKNKFGQIHDKL